MSFKFGLQTEIWNDTISVRIGFKDTVEGTFQIAESLVLKPSMSDKYTDPIMRLNKDEAQDLMDQLFACGISPSKLAGSTGQLAAVTYHLEDMRKLVFT